MISPPPGGVDPAVAEKQAGDLMRASIAGYGTLPDPMLATEAITTGSTPLLSSAAASGDPALQSALLAQPVGQSQYTSKGLSPPTALYDNPYAFDPSQYQSQVQQYDKANTDNSFKSMNELPMANVGWFNAITTGDTSTVRKWQQFLADRGFYGSFDSNGQNFQKGEVNGYNTQPFQDGLKQWALAYFTPQALYSRDPTEQTNARQFLSALGYDTDAIATSLSHDPAQHEKVIDSWLMAQGPDGNKVSALDTFAKHFGADALPDQLNKLRGDGIFGSIGKFLGHIPGVGNVLGTTPDQLDAKLTPAEKEILNPSLQTAHNNNGFFNFIGNALSAPSKALVTVGWMFGDAMHGQVDNPFDANSHARTEADKFVNNPMADMFGQQFVKDHSWLSTIGNVAVNILDDPVTYIPFIGEANLAEKLGEGVEGAVSMTKAEKVAVGTAKMTKVERATGGLISHRVGTLRVSQIGPKSVLQSLHDRNMAGLLTKALDPIGTAQQDMAKLLTNPNMDHGLVRELLGDTNEQSFDKIETILQLGQKGDQHAILDYLRNPNNGYAHQLFDMSTLLNRHQYDKVIANADRLNNGKQLHIWHTLHMNDSSNLADLSRPAEVVEAFRNAAMTAGVDPKEFADFTTKFWKATGDDFTRRNIADGMNDAIEKALNAKWKKSGGIKGFKEWRESIRTSAAKMPKGGQQYAKTFDPTQESVEQSVRTTYKFTKDIKDGPTADQLNADYGAIRQASNDLTAHFQEALDNFAKRLHPQGVVTDEGRQQALQAPEFSGQAEAYNTQKQGLEDKLSGMVQQYGGKAAEEPSPLLTTQAATFAHLPYTASEIMAYTSPVLRKMESVQKKLGVDKAMGLWKSIELSKPATSLRVLFGDESSRVMIHLLANDPESFMEYAKSIVTQRGKTAGEELDGILAKHPELASSLHAMAQQGFGDVHFVDMVAGDKTYAENLQRTIEQHWSKQQWVKGWQDAVQTAHDAGKSKAAQEAAGKKFLRQHLTGESEEARTLRQMAGVPDVKSGNNPLMDALVETKHTAISSFLHHDFNVPERMHMWNWVKKGVVDKKQLADLEKKLGKSTQADYILPRISGHAPETGTIWDHGFGWYHQRTSQMIGRARARGFIFKAKSEHKRLKAFYNPPGQPPVHDDATLLAMAERSAAQWVQKNTYQGSRSVAASSLRSVAPFWGATANSNRFYLHTLIEHPELAIPTAQGEEQITQAQQAGGLRFNVPLVGSALSKLGFASGDNFTWEPFNALFLTREGFGGFMPGFGPIFNVGLGAMPYGVKDWVSQNVPGMQYAASGTPMLPWATNLISAGSLAMGGGGFEAPIVGRDQGYYEKQVNDKLQQMEATWEQGGRQGAAPTVQDAKNDVARNLAVTGVGSFAAPFGVAADDTKKNSILNGEQEWDPGLAPADKQAFFQKYADVADYFKYIDPSTPEQSVDGKESKQDILARSPWVLAYSTGMGVSNVPGRVTAADTQAQYKRDVAEGNVSTMDPVAYLTKVRQSEETTQAWNEFDRLQAYYQSFLQQNGVTTTSPQAVQWRKLNYDPYINALAKEYPDWGATFVKQTSTSQTGLEFASAPFSSVSTFQVLPQNPALETKATTLWRAALIRRDQATSALEQVIAAGGSQQEKQMILDGLAQQMDALASQDPTFAGQIARYRYKSLNDLITSQAQQQANLAQGYPSG